MRVLMVVNVDKFLISHRLPIALAALQAGHEVHIATTLTQGRALLESHGFIVHSLEIDRSGARPAELISLFLNLLSLFWRLRPDVLHLVTIKPVLIGGLAARLAPVGGVIYAISGLGHVFVAEGAWGKLRRILVKAWYRRVLRVRNMRVIFQNSDDLAQLSSLASLKAEQVVVIPGSGVSLEEYTVHPLPKGQPVVMMASRLLVTKGVREFVHAAQLLQQQAVSAKFWLVGDVDSGNPASIEAKELENWQQMGLVEILGHREDMAGLMAMCTVVVLPSYREGLPKVLIEAAASGRPVVTTDVPGCCDAIEDGVTGLLVPARDAQALARGVQQLLQNIQACEEMGKAGRVRAERFFDVNSVVRAHLEIYRALNEKQ